MVKKKHTETPWDYKNGGLTITKRGRGTIAIIPPPGNSGVFECVANAEYIVRAVNNFEPMLALLKQLVNEGWNAGLSEDAAEILKVIAAAEKESGQKD